MKIKIKKSLLFWLKPVFCAAFFILLAFPGLAYEQEDGRVLYKADEILVKYKADEEAQTQRYDPQQLEEIEKTSGFETVYLTSDQNIWEKIQEYELNPEVEYVEPVILRKASKSTDDPYFYLQWHLNQSTDVDIDAGKAWNKTTGTKSTVIAVIDSGVDLDHEDLEDNIWENSGEIANNGVDDDGNGYVDDLNGWDFVNDNKNPNPSPDGIDNDGDGYTDYGVAHGTHVAGISAAKGNNNTGVTGVCWKCKIMALQVLSDEGWGDSANIAKAINYAADNGADVINLSLGSYGYSTAEYLAVADAVDKGVAIVAATGNDTIDLAYYPNYPSCYEDVIGVTATDSYDGAAYFTNYGEECADVAAPGNYIYSTMYINSTYGFYYDYDYMSGTSMASPLVAGVMGLLKSYSSSASLKKLRNALYDGVEDIGLTRDYGRGRVNAHNSLRELRDTSKPSAPTKIKAYKKPNKKQAIKKGSRTKERSPYFAWNKGTDNKGVSGYYVYWGRKKKGKPKKQGDYQTKRTLKKKKLSGNEKSYYLRIKTKDNSNNLSSDTAMFKYVVDRQAKKPTNLSLKSVKKGVKLTWKCKEKHVRSYNIYRKKDGSKAWKKINKKKNKKKYYTDTSVKNKRTYNYRIQVQDTLYNSKYSKTKQIKYKS